MQPDTITAAEREPERAADQSPPPPRDGRIIGVDAHPDTFTAAVFRGQTPHDAKKLQVRADMDLAEFLRWAAAGFGKEDIFLLEAGLNSFEVASRLDAAGLRAIVLESCHVGRHAKTYADSDKLAAARIALVYLAGNAPCVWQPDPATRERRELLHLHQRAVAEHTAAKNTLKSYLACLAIRPGKRSLCDSGFRDWVLAQKEWTPLQKSLLEEYHSALAESHARRKRLTRQIAIEMTTQPAMLRVLKLLGIGQINAFALLAIIGDIRRFTNPRKLVAYLGLNPGQRTSGKSKHIVLGTGQRGRGDMRHLLIQGAQAVMNHRGNELGKWGWRLFARKGHRNIAISAIARKIAVQVWHLLSGNIAQAIESDKSHQLKLQKLAVLIGAKSRPQLGLGQTLKSAVDALMKKSQSATNPTPTQSEPNNQPV
jgi:transposase